MINLEKIHKLTKDIENELRLQLPILAVKMVESTEEIPAGAKKPVEDFGYHLSVCQAFGISARTGITISETKEDMWCFEPVVGYGFEKTPQYFLEGHNRYPESAKTLEAGAHWAQNLPRFECGRYKAIVVAPLEKVNFEPDMFMLYAFPGQLLQLLLAKNWLDGHDVKTKMSGHAGCVYSVVPVIKDKEITVTCPCSGIIRYAGLPDFYMIFSAPVATLEALFEAMPHLKKAWFSVPYNVVLKPEYPVRREYAKIARMMGMSWIPTP